jgi:hypothetical protein
MLIELSIAPIFVVTYAPARRRRDRPAAAAARFQCSLPDPRARAAQDPFSPQGLVLDRARSNAKAVVGAPI